MQKIKYYGKNDWLTRKYDNWLLGKQGYRVVSEEEVKKYSGGKGFILFIIFPPLALFGHTTKIKVIYEK